MYEKDENVPRKKQRMKCRGTPLPKRQENNHNK